MTIICILIAFTVWGLFIEYNTPTGFTGKNKPLSCPPHKWDYNKDGQLECSGCGILPGENHKPRE